MHKFIWLALLSIILDPVILNAKEQSRPVKHTHNGKTHVHILPNNGVGRHDHNGKRTNSNKPVSIPKPVSKQRTKIYENGDKYVGQFENGKRNGQGALTYAGGDKYVGQFKNDEKSGQGTVAFADGRKYVGKFKNDKRHGHGVITYTDGRKHVVQFRDDELISGGNNSSARLARLNSKLAEIKARRTQPSRSSSIDLCVPSIPSQHLETRECRAQTASGSGQNATVKITSIRDSRGTCYELSIYASSGNGSANTCAGASGSWSVSASKSGSSRVTGLNTGLASSVGWILRRL